MKEKLSDSVGLRLDRDTYNRAMQAKEKAHRKGVPAAYSTQSWFSYLVAKGIEVVGNE
jgi:hypothetical protein